MGTLLFIKIWRRGVFILIAFEGRDLLGDLFNGIVGGCQIDHRVDGFVLDVFEIMIPHAIEKVWLHLVRHKVVGLEIAHIRQSLEQTPGIILVKAGFDNAVEFVGQELLVTVKDQVCVPVERYECL